MIVGVGVDIVACDRIRAAGRRYGERFLDRVFTRDEQDYCLSMGDPVPHLAARFAAKEAGRKALATLPPLSWQDVELRRGSGGSVTLVLRGEAKRGAEALGVRAIHVSVAHERAFAVAFVVMESREV